MGPPLDVVKEDNHLVMTADVPGIKPEEIDIEIDSDELTVFGKHSEEREVSKDHYMRRERRAGSFMRSLRLPEVCDPSRSEATTHNGVLEIRIPITGKPAVQKIKVSSE